MCITDWFDSNPVCQHNIKLYIIRFGSPKKETVGYSVAFLKLLLVNIASVNTTFVMLDAPMLPKAVRHVRMMPNTNAYKTVSGTLPQ